MSKRASWILILSACTAVPGAAQSVSGPFTNPTPWNQPVATTADGLRWLVDGAEVPIPAEVLGGTYRINDAHDIVRASRPATGGECVPDVIGHTAVRVFYYRLLTGPPRAELIGSICAGEGGNFGLEGYYDGPNSPAGSTQRIAHVVELGEPDGRQRMHYIDLNSGFVTDGPFLFNDAIEAVQYAPSGNVMLLRHGVAGVADYDFIDLCPGSLGTELTTGNFYHDLGPGVTAEIANVSGCTFDILVSQGGSPLTPLNGVPDCLCVGGDPTGACCLEDGSCTIETAADCAAAGGTYQGDGSDCAACAVPTGGCCIGQSCFAGMPQEMCENFGGVWQGPDSDCSGCPMPVLAISMTAPVSVSEGSELTYTLNFSNTGDTATGVILRDALPAGTTFVSADGDGELANGLVTWQIGTLPGGSSDSRSLTVRVSCGGPSTVTNQTYSIQAGFNIVNGVPVSTTVEATSASPVDVVVAQTPAREPLQYGDLVTYELTLTNPSSEPRAALRMGTALDSWVDFEQVLDDGGGEVTVNGRGLEWRGPLGPLGSTTVAFTARVRECALGREVRLGQVFVQNSCGVQVGMAPSPPAIAMIQPVSIEWSVLDVGPVQHWFNGASIVALRQGAAYTFQAIFVNNSDAPQPLSAGLGLPGDWTPVGDPPFVAPTDPNATYDPLAGEIRWNGTVPPGETRRVTFQATPPTDACETSMFLAASTAGCSNNINGLLWSILIPEPPAVPHVAHLSPFSGVDTIVLPFSREDLVCMHPEIHGAMARGPNGDLWISGLPNMLVNPRTLRFLVFDADDFSGTQFARRVTGLPDVTGLGSVAVDPRDGTGVYLAGNGALGAVGRYDPNSDTATPLVQSPQLSACQAIVVAPDGTIGLLGLDELIEVDPNDPNNLATIDPNAGSLLAMALDPNDDYVVLTGELPRRLLRIDRQSHAVTTLVADLHAIAPNLAGTFPRALVMTDDGRAIIAAPFGAAAVIDLSDPPSAQPANFDSTAGVVWVPGAPACGDLDGNGVVDVSDMGLLLHDFGNPGPAAPGDVDGDGDCDMEDLSVVLAQFNGACS